MTSREFFSRIKFFFSGLIMAKVLITGGSGFIGSHLVPALAARGDEVTCLVRKTSKINSLLRWGIRVVYGDVREPGSLAGAIAGQEIVYHLAGLTTTLSSKQFFQVNRGGCRNMAQACALRPQPPVLLVVSSLAAAGPAFNGRPKTETDPALPVSSYGRSKRGEEEEAEFFADRVPTTIIRPPIVLGERDRAGLSIFRSIDKLGIHLVPGLDRRRFSLIHAADLAELMILAAERGKRLPPLGRNGKGTGQGYYFAACEEDLIYDDLGQLIGKALGRKVFALHVAIPLVWLMAAGIEVISQIEQVPFYMNIDKAREAAAGSWICSARRASEELGFTVKAPLVERLRQTAQWYRAAGWL
jgi:nucleoside-diphosphate-sugar epimerase